MLLWAAPRAAACLRCGRNQPGPVSRPPACAKGQRRRAPGCRARRVGSRAEPAGWHAALQRRACGARGPRAGRPAASAAAAAGGARTPADAASGLPIAEVLGDVLRALDDDGALVLQAPPGAGKTSAVPLALLLAAPACCAAGSYWCGAATPGAARRRAGPRAELRSARHTALWPARWARWARLHACEPVAPPGRARRAFTHGSSTERLHSSSLCPSAVSQPALLSTARAAVASQTLTKSYPTRRAGGRAPAAGGARGRAAHGRAAGRARGRPRRLPHPRRRRVRAGHGRPGGHHRRAAAPPAARAPPRAAWPPACCDASLRPSLGLPPPACCRAEHARPYVARTLPRL